MVAASGAAPVDLGKAIEAAPAVPKLSIPVSQGTTGGVLLHKVQPVYPPEARRLHMTGSVVIDATVNEQGPGGRFEAGKRRSPAGSGRAGCGPHNGGTPPTY